MKPNSIMALLLIVAGVAVFAYQGITYQSREKVVDLGALQVTAERTHTLPLPPILGAAAIIGGIALLVLAGRKS